MSVTLVHPAKAAGRNEMPIGRDNLVIPSNIVLDRGPRFSHGKGRFEGRNPLPLGVTPSRCVCIHRTAYIVYRLHAALVSAAKVMRCMQCFLVIVINIYVFIYYLLLFLFFFYYHAVNL